MTRNVRKLTTFFDLAFEMAFFIEQVLETKMRLVHLLPCVCCCLLVSAGGCIGMTVERLEACDESCGLDADCCLIYISIFWVDELPELVDGRVVVGLASVHVRKNDVSMARVTWSDGGTMM